MILRTFLLILTLFLPLYFPLHASVWDTITGFFKGHQKPEPPSIRVLLLHDVEGAKLEVRGKYCLSDPYDPKQPEVEKRSERSKRFVGKCRPVQTLGDGLKWGEAFPGTYQIKVEPIESTTKILVNDVEYDGSIYVYDVGGSISIVNQVLVEDYIRSVLAPYQYRHLETETLAALAIIARTNAYYQSANPKNTLWAIDAKKTGYQGLNQVYSAIDDAVSLTRYMIMSRTGVYEGVATPFSVQFDVISATTKEIEASRISLEEANEMALKGEHAAQILAKAFPAATIMLLQETN